MIAKIVKGSDFYGVLAYNEKKIEQGLGYVIDGNITHAKACDMTNEFNIIRQLRPGLGVAVFHASLNLPHEDDLSDSEFSALGYDYLLGMGFDDNQYIIYRHSDQKHDHIHIIANRVKYSGEVVNDSKDLLRSKELVRKLEVKYKLTKLPIKRLKAGRALTQKELEKAIRIGQVPIRLLLQLRIEKAINNSSNLREFVQELESVDIWPKFNRSKSTGRVSGISFRYKDVIYMGSRLGKNFSWNSIIKQIDYEQERDDYIILRSNRTERKNYKTFISSIAASTGTQRRSVKTDQQSKNHLGKVQTNQITPLDSETNWNPFKLELSSEKVKKGKRKKKKRDLNL